MFSVHVLRTTYGCDDLYPICTKLRYMEPACIVWLYNACSYTVATSPGIILSFAVLHTEKLAFQCATLVSWEEGLEGDNVTVLCGDFWTFFFLFSVLVS